MTNTKYFVIIRYKVKENKIMENKLIKINSEEKLGGDLYQINADFMLGNIWLVVSSRELKRLKNGGNMDRLTKDKYK